MTIPFSNDTSVSSWRLWTYRILVATIVLAVGSLAWINDGGKYLEVNAQPNAQPDHGEAGINWPLHMVYEVTYPQQGSVTSTFDFLGASWSEWRLSEVAGKNPGYVMEVRPDGRVLAGYPEWPELELLGRRDPDEKRVPASEFLPRETNILELQRMNNVVLQPERASEASARLGLNEADVVAYTVATAVSEDSYVVYTPLSLPLAAASRTTDGTVTSTMKVVELEMMTPGTTIFDGDGGRGAEGKRSAPAESPSTTTRP